jgi:hypothetical protein
MKEKGRKRKEKKDYVELMDKIDASGPEIQAKRIHEE